MRRLPLLSSSSARARRGLVLLGSAGLALGFAGCKAAPKPFPDETELAPAPVRIAFAPPEGVPVVERSVQTRTERARGAAAAAQESVTAVLESTFTKAGDGYVLTQRVPEIHISQNGTEVQSELAELVTKFPVTVRLANDGSFVELTNGDEIETALRAAITDPQQQDAVLAAFTPEALEQETKAEWATKYGELLGREVNVGMAWYGVETLGTSGGDELAYVLEHKLTQIRQTEHGREAVVVFSCPLAPKDAADPAAMQRAWEERRSLPLEPTVSCAGQQIVALEPFAPKSTELEVKAAPAHDGAAPVEVSFSRSVHTERIGPAAPAPKAP